MEKIYGDDSFQFVESADAKYDEMVTESLTYWQDAWLRLKANKVAMISLGILIILIILSIIGPYMSPYKFDQQSILEINQAPSKAHLFGTDDLGRDIFVRAWYGARVSLFIAFFTAFINLFIGIIYGGISGYFGGVIDNIMMRIIDIMYSIPYMIWIIMLMVVIGPGLKTMIIAFTLTGWGFMARLVRGQVLQIREMEYVQASTAFGAGTFRIIMKHLLPNCIGPILVQLTFSIPSAIFTEAFLSYIGLGIPIPLASWGTLANDGARMLLIHPYQLVFPALLISITMLSFNLLGDGLRDALDPRMK
jgi:oligopeptide transport system permease protein